MGCPFRERPFSDRSLFALRLLAHLNVDVLAARACRRETRRGRHKSKQGMVLAQADVVARVPLRAALADDDVAGDDVLAAELLDAEALDCESRPLREEPPAFLCAIFESTS